MNRDYAIVVGIDKYPRLPELSSAVRDANAFAEWLRKPAPEGGGITDSERLQIIVSPEEQSDVLAEPLQIKIDRALEGFGVDKGLIGRRLYFYFSGHGIGVEFDDVAMLMANASMNALNSNAGLRPYRSFFKAAVLFKEIVFILDCCRDQVKRLQINPMPPVFTVAAQNPDPVNDYVFLATAHNEPAFSVPAGNGLLTEALVEGLNGAAADLEGRVTSKSLSNYVESRVKERGNELKLKQEQLPKFQGEITGGLLFCTVVNEVDVKIHAAPNITGTLLVLAGTEEKGRQDISLFDKDNPWTLRLPYSSIPYFIQHLPSGKMKTLDLSQIKDKNYEFQFSIPE